MVGGKPSAAAIPFFEGSVALKNSRLREGKGNGDNISASVCAVALKELLLKCC